jgi:hypothetical protein
MEIASKIRIKYYLNKIIATKIFCPKLIYADGVHAA